MKVSNSIQKKTKTSKLVSKLKNNRGASVVHDFRVMSIDDINSNRSSAYSYLSF